jgi:hypothetical protein
MVNRVMHASTYHVGDDSREQNVLLMLVWTFLRDVSIRRDDSACG